MNGRYVEKKETYLLQGLCPPVLAASLSRVRVVWGVVVSHCGGCALARGVEGVGSIGWEGVMAVITEIKLRFVCP